MTDDKHYTDGIVRLNLNVMESEVIEEIIEFEIGAEKCYEDGDMVLEPMDKEAKRELVDKIREREREYSRSRDHEAAQWCQQASLKVMQADIEHSVDTDTGRSE